MRARRPAPVTIELKGKTYRGSYFAKRGMVAVQYGSRQRVAQRGNARPKSLASIMLGDLITEDPEKW